MLSFVVLIIGTFTAVAKAGDVWTLTDSDFNSRIADQDLVLVKYYAPWCGHCKQIAPEFEKAATVLKYNDPPVVLAEVDCTAEGKESCSQAGVSGYPTLKAYKHGQTAFDYDGPRDADGIVKYMKSKAGPSTKELLSVEDAVKFLDNPEHSIIGFFDEASSGEAFQEFQKLASALSDDFRFAHSFSADVLNKYGYKDDIVIFQPSRLVTKLEPSQTKYTGTVKLTELKQWVHDNIHGLVGHRTSSNSKQFNSPLIVVYYDVDYVKNPKGSNYWRNRVIKVAKSLSDAGKKLNFAVSNSADMSHELSEYGLTGGASDKPLVTARDEKGQKFTMSAEFSVEGLEQFANELIAGSLEPYMKSEPIPTSNTDEKVKVVVARQFNEIVNDPDKDVLIEFYAPWCGHCKSLAPKYEELANKLSDEDEIVIAKMDATANDVPKHFEVSGFPTIYFVKRGSKDKPVSYEGEREVDDFIKYLAKESTNPLKGWTRDGKRVKGKKGKSEL